MSGLPPPPLTFAAWLRVDAIRRGLADARPIRILEVGAGQGAMAWRLAKEFDYVGLEPDERSFAIASERLERLGAGSVIRGTTSTFDASDLFDLVCAFEVLEHLPDDEGELRRWHGLLRPEGHALISVPAHSSRFGPADRAVGHERRYNRPDIERLLAGAGFEPVWIESWGAGLGHVLEALRHLIAALHLARIKDDPTGRSGRWLQPRGRVSGWTTVLLTAPARALQYFVRRRDWGIGWVVLARRSDPNRANATSLRRELQSVPEVDEAPNIAEEA